MSRTTKRLASMGAAALLLASCGATGFDPDLRGWMPGALSTADAAARAAPRPQPDSRGVITFPNYQVAVARSGDTVGSVAARLGIDAARLAQHNALPANAPLAAGQTLVLSQRVAVGTGLPGSATSPVPWSIPSRDRPVARRPRPLPPPRHRPPPRRQVQPTRRSMSWPRERRPGRLPANMTSLFRTWPPGTACPSP
ncbi:LysM peptidoglycan-binding domain-containing protein [Paracoccus aerius]